MAFCPDRRHRCGDGHAVHLRGITRRAGAAPGLCFLILEGEVTAREYGNQPLGLLFDHTIGNILRMLAVIRLPKLERGPVSHGFVATLIVIMGYGLVMLFSASYSSGYANYGDVYHFIRPQGVIAVLGLVAMLIISNINYRALRYMNESFTSLPLCCSSRRCSARRIPTAPTAGSTLQAVPSSLQPSELAKFSVMLWTADMLDRDHAHKTSIWYGLLKPALPLVPILILLKLEPHNSAILLLCAIFRHDDPLQRLRHAMVADGRCGGCGRRDCILKAPRQRRWLCSRPSGRRLGPDPHKHSRHAVANFAEHLCDLHRRMFGVGIGNSVQKHQWLPYAETTLSLP